MWNRFCLHGNAEQVQYINNYSTMTYWLKKYLLKDFYKSEFMYKLLSFSFHNNLKRSISTLNSSSWEVNFNPLLQNKQTTKVKIIIIAIFTPEIITKTWPYSLAGTQNVIRASFTSREGMFRTIIFSKMLWYLQAENTINLQFKILIMLPMSPI